MGENLADVDAGFEGSIEYAGTLSLFFIDSIKSYRDDEGWLKLKFECLLKKKLTQLIDDYQRKTLPREVEYLSFLQAKTAEAAMRRSRLR